MTPRFPSLFAALALFATSCAKAPPGKPSLGSVAADERTLWPVVAKLAADSEALLKEQEELIWKNWTEGAPAKIAQTYEGKEKLFSLESVQTIDALRRRLIDVYQCKQPDPGLAALCQGHPGGALEVRALTHLHMHFVGEYLSRLLSEQSEAIANLEASMTFTAGGTSTTIATLTACWRQRRIRKRGKRSTWGRPVRSSGCRNRSGARRTKPRRSSRWSAMARSKSSGPRSGMGIWSAWGRSQIRF